MNCINTGLRFQAVLFSILSQSIVNKNKPVQPFLIKSCLIKLRQTNSLFTGLYLTAFLLLLLLLLCLSEEKQHIYMAFRDK